MAVRGGVLQHKEVECRQESLILHIQSADGRMKNVVVNIFRQWGRRLAVPSALAVLCAGCYRAAPPSDEWLKENFCAHRADFDSVVAIAGSAAADDFVRYPPDTTSIYDPAIGKERLALLWSEADSLFVTGLGEDRRATLDSLLHRIGCTGIECYPPDGVIGIVCYTYGNMDGFTVQYTYCQNRPDDMFFYEDRDLHEMWKEYTLDKANRPMPRKRLNDYWSIEYRP